VESNMFCSNCVRWSTYWCAEVGFGLRKDDPTTLRQLLIDIHSKSDGVDVTAFSDPYVHLPLLGDRFCLFVDIASEQQSLNPL